MWEDGVAPAAGRPGPERPVRGLDRAAHGREPSACASSRRRDQSGAGTAPATRWATASGVLLDQRLLLRGERRESALVGASADRHTRGGARRCVRERRRRARAGRHRPRSTRSGTPRESRRRGGSGPVAAVCGRRARPRRCRRASSGARAGSAVRPTRSGCRGRRASGRRRARRRSRARATSPTRRSGASSRAVPTVPARSSGSS